MNIDPWALIHRYNRLVQQDLAKPLACPDCSENLVVMLGDNDTMILWCLSEDKTFKPGLAFFSDLKAVVSEYYLE